MRPTVRAACAVTAIAFVLSPAAAVEEKSTKPRIAVIEFASKAGAQLEVDSAQWGEWIADVERPQAAGSWAKADGLGVSWDVPESRSSAGGANDRLRSAGPKDGWPARGRGVDIAQIDGEIVSPSSTAGKQPKTRPMLLAPGATKPRSGRATGLPPELPVMAESGAPGQPKTSTAIGSAIGNRAGDGNEDAASGQATGKRQHMPIRTRAHYDTPLERGSVMLRLAQPWAGCAVGDRFDGVYLTTGVSHRYRLDGAEIVGCSGSRVTINYTKSTAAGEPVR